MRKRVRRLWLLKPMLISLSLVSLSLPLIFLPSETSSNSLNLKSTVTSSSKNTVSIPDNFGQKIAEIRDWDNNSFNGVELEDGGYVFLTKNGSSFTATRTDSLGSILWEFNPNLLGPAHANKIPVEVVQDQGSDKGLFYILLAPEKTPEEIANSSINKDATDPVPYSGADVSLTTDESKQATVVQIRENLTNYNGEKWEPTISILDALHINPERMVENYPSSWTKDEKDPTFFSQTDHASWYVTNDYDNEVTLSPTMIMPWKQYITNLGNMYAVNGKVLMFGGNGTIFHDPEALSIGFWRIDFNNQQVTGIPYAYALSGLNWDFSNTTYDQNVSQTILNKDQTYTQSYNNSASEAYGQEYSWWGNNNSNNIDGVGIIPNEYKDSYLNQNNTQNHTLNMPNIPIGQNQEFAFVPRLAVAGVEPNHTDHTNSTVTSLYVAGSITIGQDSASLSQIWNIAPEIHEWGWRFYNGKLYRSDGSGIRQYVNSKRSVQPSGTNFIPQKSMFDTNDQVQLTKTFANSIDPLSIFGTYFRLDQLLNIQPEKIDEPTQSNMQKYFDLLLDRRYFDTGGFAGLTASKQITLSGTDNVGTSDYNNDPTQLNGVTMDAMQVFSTVTMLLNPTIGLGHSTKSVGYLTQFHDENNTPGFTFQVGGALISFVEPTELTKPNYRSGSNDVAAIKQIIFHSPSLSYIEDNPLRLGNMRAQNHVKGNFTNPNYVASNNESRHTINSVTSKYSSSDAEGINFYGLAMFAYKSLHIAKETTVQHTGYMTINSSIEYIGSAYNSIGKSIALCFDTNKFIKIEMDSKPEDMFTNNWTTTDPITQWKDYGGVSAVNSNGTTSGTIAVLIKNNDNLTVSVKPQLNVFSDSDISNNYSYNNIKVSYTNNMMQHTGSDSTDSQYPSLDLGTLSWNVNNKPTVNGTDRSTDYVPFAAPESNNSNVNPNYLIPTNANNHNDDWFVTQAQKTTTKANEASLHFATLTNEQNKLTVNFADANVVDRNKHIVGYGSFLPNASTFGELSRPINHIAKEMQLPGINGTVYVLNKDIANKIFSYTNPVDEQGNSIANEWYIILANITPNNSGGNVGTLVPYAKNRFTNSFELITNALTGDIFALDQSNTKFINNLGPLTGINAGLIIGIVIPIILILAAAIGTVIYIHKKHPDKLKLNIRSGKKPTSLKAKNMNQTTTSSSIATKPIPIRTSTKPITTQLSTKPIPTQSSKKLNQTQPIIRSHSTKPLTNTKPQLIKTINSPNNATKIKNKSTGSTTKSLGKK